MKHKTKHHCKAVNKMPERLDGACEGNSYFDEFSYDHGDGNKGK